MKINTDGTLLGALSGKGTPASILDIGAGTGVVALMLAQRYPNAAIDAVEIEDQAALTAKRNFENSPFSNRLTLHGTSFQSFSRDYPEKKYELIVSNPPFFLDSLKNPDKKKEKARHTNEAFFKELVSFTKTHLSETGQLSLILPPATASLFLQLSRTEGIFPFEIHEIKSFESTVPHRHLVSFSFSEQKTLKSSFIIYVEQKQYSDEFINSLKDFFTIF